MVIYWKWQFWIDLALVFGVTVVVTNDIFPFVSGPPEWNVIIQACRQWVAPILTLLGLVCATTAFLFTALDRSEFTLLRTIGVEDQLWAIFSEIIFWLAVSAISAATISFVESDQFAGVLGKYAFFLFGMVVLCLLKFAWVMRHIIGVRIRRT